MDGFLLVNGMVSGHAKDGWAGPGAKQAAGEMRGGACYDQGGGRARGSARRAGAFFGRCLVAEAGVGPVVVAVDVLPDLPSRLLDRLPLRAPGAAFLELAEPGLDECLGLMRNETSRET